MITLNGFKCTKFQSFSLLFQEIVKIIDNEMELGMKMTYFFSWYDPRIKNLNLFPDKKWENFDFKFAKEKIYVPRIYLENFIEYSTNKMLGSSDESLFITSNHTIL